MKITEYIAREKFNFWYALFKCSGGRFVINPLITGSRVMVIHEHDDMEKYNDFAVNYQHLTTQINETKRGFLKKLKVKFSGWTR